MLSASAALAEEADDDIVTEAPISIVGKSYFTDVDHHRKGKLYTHCSSLSSLSVSRLVSLYSRSLFLLSTVSLSLSALYALSTLYALSPSFISTPLSRARAFLGLPRSCVTCISIVLALVHIYCLPSFLLCTFTACLTSSCAHLLLALLPHVRLFSCVFYTVSLCGTAFQPLNVSLFLVALFLGSHSSYFYALP